MIIVTQQDEIYEQDESESQEWVIKVGDTIQSRFYVSELLGEGSFGQVFKVLDRKKNSEALAMKVEYESEDEESMLAREIKIIKELQRKTGFPQIRYYGQEASFTYYIMNLLGPNLESTSKKCGGSFSLSTVLKLAIQMLARIETLHSLRLIHRDIKPDNFVLGTGNQNQIIHLIDFGLSKYYLNSKGDHIKQVRKKGLIGTARYASINAHNEYEQSRRDDLESICYVLIYLALGQLPWMNLQIEQKDLKYAKILHLKKSITPQMLCQGLPDCFLTVLVNVKQLGFEDAPNYTEYRRLFQAELEKNHTKQACMDWEQQGDKKKSLTMHILPKQLKKDMEVQNQLVAKQGKLDPKAQEPQKQDQKDLTQQFDKFDQLLHQNQKKYVKMSSSKRASSNKGKKQPIFINVCENEEQLPFNKSDSILVIEQKNTLQPQLQTSKSYKLLQPPSATAINNHDISLQSLNTSRVNNYDWSEEVSSEGKPIWTIYTEALTPQHQIVQQQPQNIMTGIKAKQKNYRRSNSKINCFSALQYPQQNQVKGSDEEIVDID